MNADAVKSAMLWHILYRLHYPIATTEYGGKGCSGIADLFAMQESSMLHEFEVKVSAGDLDGELAAIEYLLSEKGLGLNAQKPPRSLSKASKHRIYLGQGNPVFYEIEMRPNRFSFVVPETLKERALNGLKNTPYGLYVVSVGTPVCTKKADYLHKNKASSDTILKIAHKACTEVEFIRGKILQDRRCTHCHKDFPKQCPECKTEIKKSRDYRRQSDACWAKVASLPREEQGKAWNVCMEGTSHN